MKKAEKETVVEASADKTQVMSKTERQALLDCESKIEQAQEDYKALGAALTQISEARLYKGSHKSFDEYSFERWDFSGSHARRFMNAHKVVQKLRLDSKPVKEEELPRNEYQARLLFESKQPNHWVRCWKNVLKIANERGKKVTTSLIEEVLNGKAEGKPEAKPKTSKKEPAPNGGVVKALKRIDEVREKLSSNQVVNWSEFLAEIETLLGKRLKS